MLAVPGLGQRPRVGGDRGLEPAVALGQQAQRDQGVGYHPGRAAPPARLAGLLGAGAARAGVLVGQQHRGQGGQGGRSVPRWAGRRAARRPRRARRPGPPRPRPGRAGRRRSRLAGPAAQHGVGVGAQVVEQAAQLVRGPRLRSAGDRPRSGPTTGPGRRARRRRASPSSPDPVPQRQGQVISAGAPPRARPAARPSLRHQHGRGERGRDVVAGQGVVGQLARGAGDLGQAPLIGQQLRPAASCSLVRSPGSRSA